MTDTEKLAAERGALSDIERALDNTCSALKNTHCSLTVHHLADAASRLRQAMLDLEMNIGCIEQQIKIRED